MQESGAERGRQAPRRSRRLELQDAFTGGRHTLILGGELDIASASEMEVVMDRLTRGGTQGVTLDLRRVRCIDSCGLGAILNARKMCQARTFDFELVPGPPQVQRLFQLTGLLDVLPLAAAA